MKKTFALLPLFLCLIQTAYAMNITGKIIDKETDKPLLGATVKVINKADSTLISGAKTNKDGNFEIKNVSNQNALLRASMVGYSDLFVDLSIYKGMKLDLETLKMEVRETKTDEVQVYAAKDMIKTEPDKVVVNVDKMLTTSGGSAVDVLRNVPSVKVDIENNVSLRGNSNIKVLVDGKPSGLGTAEILDQTPAELIEKIEVITNPSSKFDPEGNAGIINIILKKKKEGGINGMISGNAGNYDRNSGSINLNYRSEKFNIFGSYNLRMMSRDGNSIISRTFFDTSNATPYNYQEGEFSRRFTGHTFKLGADYYFNDYNSLTFYINYNTMKRKPNDSNFYKVFTRDSLPFDYYSVRSNSEMEYNTYDYSLSYKTIFEKNKEELNVDLFLSPSENTPYSEYRRAEYNPADMSKIGNSVLNNQDRISKNSYFSVSSDYFKKYNEFTKLELGYKSFFRHSDQDYKYNTFNETSSQWELDALKTNDFVYDESIHSLYGTYTDKFLGVNFQFGLRAEYTYTKGNQRTQNIVNQNDYFSLFPSVHAKYNITELNEIGLSYARRINRPWHRQVNPFIDYSDPLNLETGNPALKPSYTNNFQISDNLITDKAMITASLYYNQTTDGIEELRKVLPGGVTMETYENLSKMDNLGIELFASYQFFKWWRLDVSYNYYKYKYDVAGSQIDINETSTGWSANANTDIKIYDLLSLQINAYYTAPSSYGQYEEKEQFSVSLGARTEFKLFGNDAALTYNISDLFKTLNFQENYKTKTFRINDESIRITQYMSLGFTYKFNDYKRQRDKNSSGFDDMD